MQNTRGLLYSVDESKIKLLIITKLDFEKLTLKRKKKEKKQLIQKIQKIQKIITKELIKSKLIQKN